MKITFSPQRADWIEPKFAQSGAPAKRSDS